MNSGLSNQEGSIFCLIKKGTQLTSTQTRQQQTRVKIRPSTPLQRLEVEQITGHQTVRGRGGVIAVLYKTHWAGLSEPSWEREMDFHLSRSNGWRWSRSLVISRYGGEVASSRCYTIRIGRDSPNPPGSGKWTFTSPARTSRDIGPEPWTSTAKPTTSTAECGSGRLSVSSPATTGKVS